jgi:hypothetical protein
MADGRKNNLAQCKPALTLFRHLPLSSSNIFLNLGSSEPLHEKGIPVLDNSLDNSLDDLIVFESANPSEVKSIKQHDLLNTWLRLYVGEQKIPAIAGYRPEGSRTSFPTSSISTSMPAQSRCKSSSRARARGYRQPMGTPARDARSTSISERGSCGLLCPPVTSVYVARFRFTPLPTLMIFAGESCL